jgi:hypothetical protein
VSQKVVRLIQQHLYWLKQQFRISERGILKMAYPNALPAGLLSFVYHAVYNQQVIVDLRAERTDDVLTAFELNTAEQKAVSDALTPGQVDEKLLQNIANLMAPYVVKAYNDILEEIKTKEEDSAST